MKSLKSLLFVMSFLTLPIQMKAESSSNPTAMVAQVDAQRASLNYHHYPTPMTH